MKILEFLLGSDIDDFGPEMLSEFIKANCTEDDVVEFANVLVTVDNLTEEMGQCIWTAIETKESAKAE